MECCPPSTWNPVRDHRGILSAISLEPCPRWRGIRNLPKVFLEKGDISTTLPAYLEKNPATVIGLLHLDIDLYQPTIDTLKHTLKRMPKGAVIVFDEINHKDYPGETIAVAEALGLNHLELRRVREASAAAYVRL